jgi:NAD(P)-dependent dehydrogenase (short-subunit alcohol dehydrogenase family)
MAQEKKEGKQTFPPQQQEPPGNESEMHPKPRAKNPDHVGTGKLQGQTALITGGDSGIGRAVAIAFAREGADVAIVYLSEQRDAEETKQLVEAEGCGCLLIPGNVGEETFCISAVEQTLAIFGRLDILVNNAAEQTVQESIEDISEAQLASTFRTNIFSHFFLTKAALKHMKRGSTIINTTSVTAYRGHPELIDYASTKGAQVAFTRSLSTSLLKRGIRVNAVAPGPIWTPLIVSSFDEEKVQSFGADTPMGRAGQPEEVAACFVFLASEDSSYISGQVIHPNGGEVVNG